MEKVRNSNIELLRIISMAMVLVLHALGWSEALNVTAILPSVVYWSMVALVTIAVNEFVLISGFFLVKSNFKTKNVFKTAVGGGVALLCNIWDIEA